MREETLNPMQEAIAFGRVIPGAAAEFTNEPRAEEFYSDAFSAEGNENSALREAAKSNAERQSEAVKKGTNGGGSGGGFDRWRMRGAASGGFRTLILYLIPAILAAAVIIAAVWGNRQKTLAENYRRTAENIYRAAYHELTESVYNLNIMLSKLLISEAPATLCTTLDDIRHESGICVGLMAQIPQSHIDNAELNAFLVRISDYSEGLAGRVLRGTPLSNDDREQLAALFEASGNIYAELQTKLSSGDIPVAAIAAEDFFESENSNAAHGGNASNAGQDEADSRYPTLIYDGPFSESTEKREPQGLSGAEIDEAEAYRRAKAFFGGAGSETQPSELKLASCSGGKIPSYDFSGKFADGREFDLSITVRGGELLWFMTSAEGHSQDAPNESETDALNAAGPDFLAAKGYPAMRATYAQYYPGAVLISYAATENIDAETSDSGSSAGNSESAGGNNVIIYNDLVKIWIDRTTKKIVGADARNYLFSHTERSFPTVLAAEEDVRTNLAPGLEIVQTNLALIPQDDQTEKLCYEYKVRFGGNDYAVYLDAVTGDEVQIFRIIEDENGQLAV